MGFFSTAERSPLPGQATRALGTLSSRQQMSISRDKLLQEALVQTRLTNLSQSLLDLEDKSPERVKDWALQNRVSASELKSLKPILDMTVPEDEDENWSEPGLDRTLGKITQRGPQGQVKVLGDPFGQEEEGWGAEYYHEALGQMVQKHTDGRIKTLGERASDKAAREKAERPRVADWQNHVEDFVKDYVGKDPLTFTEEDRALMGRVHMRVSQLTEQKAEALGTTPEAAMPAAINQFYKEEAWANQAVELIPQAERGGLIGDGNRDETVEIVKRLQQQQMPVNVIGQVLKKKGWREDEIFNIMNISEYLVPARESLLDPQKVKKLDLKDGEGLENEAGSVWVKEGEFMKEVLSGRRIRIDELYE